MILAIIQKSHIAALDKKLVAMKDTITQLEKRLTALVNSHDVLAKSISSIIVAFPGTTDNVFAQLPNTYHTTATPDETIVMIQMMVCNMNHHSTLTPISNIKNVKPPTNPFTTLNCTNVLGTITHSL